MELWGVGVRSNCRVIIIMEETKLFTFICKSKKERKSDIQILRQFRIKGKGGIKREGG